MRETDSLLAIRAEVKQGRLSEAATSCLALLRREPRNLEAIFLYGKVAMDLGRPSDAIVILQKLLAMAPDHCTAHDNLAYLFHQLGDYSTAKTHAKEALRLDGTLVEPHLIFGSILLSEHKEIEGLKEFELARSMAPGNLVVETAYVEALLTSGQFAPVIELVRDLISRHPQESSLYATLARSQKLNEGDPDVALIRSLTDTEGKLRKDIRDVASHCRPAYMALFKVESDLGNHPGAFRYLHKAKKVRKEQQPYNASETEIAFTQEREIFDRDFMQTRKSAGCADSAPIFVVGMPRSGTTLLERVLASHPNITAAGELPIVARLKEQACAKFGRNQRDVGALRNIPEEAWRHLGEEYLLCARQRVPGNGSFVDKLPGNFFNLGFIKLMLPQAKIIHLSRHPVANCLSIFEQDFATTHPFASDLNWLGLYYLQYKQMMEYWRGLFGQDIIELTYESLVADRERTSQYLGTRLGFDFETGEIGDSQQEGRILTASLWQARQPVHSKSIARWEQCREQLEPLIETLSRVLDP